MKTTKRKTFAHTPGPWTSEYGQGYGRGSINAHIFQRSRARVIKEASDQTIAVCHIPPYYEGKGLSERAIGEMEANGYLVAASPDLLDVAEAIVTAIEGQMIVLPSHVEKHLLDGAKAAIAKARPEGRIERTDFPDGCLDGGAIPKFTPANTAHVERTNKRKRSFAETGEV